MSGFYKMDPAAWDFGTADLSLEEEAAYLRIVNAIHKHDGPVPNNDRVLAGLFRSSTRKARALLDALVSAGKVVIEDGKIWNDRARSDLVHRQLASGSAAVRGSKGGRKRAENAAKALECKDSPKANASSRIEENRIEDSEAKASDASVDFAKQLFDRGVVFLSRHGTPDRQARTLIGKWRKAYQDTDIFDAFTACSKEGATDPIPWIAARLGRKEKINGKCDKQQRKLDAFIAGSTGSSPMDSGANLYPALPLLARG
jgi:uncharacterized protein YdaU (DUF1376 family)